MPTHAEPEHDLQQQHTQQQVPDSAYMVTKEPHLPKELQAGKQKKKTFTAWRHAGTIDGKIYVKQKEQIHTYFLSSPLMLGNITDWKNVLAGGDANFEKYLLTFLLLATEPSLAGGDAKAFAEALNPYFQKHGGQIITQKQAQDEQSGSLMEDVIRNTLFGSLIDTHLIADFKNSISQVPSEYEIMSFMMALYTNDGKLDLPKATSGDAFWGSKNMLLEQVGQSLTNDKLATLIARYQGKVIEEKSRTSINSLFNRKSVIKLGNETNENHFSTVPSEVAQNMVYSGLASAISASKLMLGNIVSEKYEAKTDRLAYNMVANSAKIAGDALKSYDGVLTRTNDQLKAMFGSVWDRIPKPTLVTSVMKLAWANIENIAKTSLQTSFITKYGNASGAKNWQDDVANEYNSTLQMMIDAVSKEETLCTQTEKLEAVYRSLDTAFRAYINQK